MKLISWFMLFLATSSFAAAPSPAGSWKTIDDVTGHVKSFIQLSIDSQNILSGRITQTFPEPGKPLRILCSACSGELHNRPIVGLVILKNMKLQGDQWNGGTVLDPVNGKEYRCT